MKKLKKTPLSQLTEMYERPMGFDLDCPERRKAMTKRSQTSDRQEDGGGGKEKDSTGSTSC